MLTLIRRVCLARGAFAAAVDQALSETCRNASAGAGLKPNDFRLLFSVGPHFSCESLDIRICVTTLDGGTVLNVIASQFGKDEYRHRAVEAVASPTLH